MTSPLRILVAPGAFKHSLTAAQVATAMIRGLTESGLAVDCVPLPIADGGNGTLNAFLLRGGDRVSVLVRGPFGATVEAQYGLVDSRQTAVIEMALASGIELVSERNPMIATTFGTGQLMQHALDSGVKKIIIGMGGSATVDGGAGALSALGVRLRDKDGEDVPLGGGGLSRVWQIDTSNLDARWKNVEVVIASDVNNPTTGENGAAAVFGPQKGATKIGVELLEANLGHFFRVVRDQVGVDVLSLPGGGAAGGLAAGLVAFLGGKIESGVEMVLRHNRVDKLLPDIDLVITGEGQIDSQSVGGKGPVGLARMAQVYGVPTIALVGGLHIEDVVLYGEGVIALPIVTEPMPLDDAIARGEELVERTALRLGYLLKLGATLGKRDKN